ncbi:MAG: CHAT domain-containing protein [Bacteroidota bacterium]
MGDPVIVLAYANDRVDASRYLRDLVEEIRGVRRILEQHISPPYQIVLRPNATLEDLIEVFDRYEDQIVLFHYAGHADSLQLMLENTEGEAAGASLAGFTRMLTNLSRLSLVFLNGCTTEAHALAMIEAGIPAVVATSQLINDRAASIFATRFYERLVQQVSLSKAFKDAEIKVQTQLLTERGFRSLYWEVEDIPEVFPWGLLGARGAWRLPIRKKEAMGSITHLMIDRNRQVEIFRDNLETVLQDPSHPPQFYVIHGAREENHRSLVKRFKEDDIRYQSERLMGMQNGYVYFYDVKDWPYTGELGLRKRNLKRAIARATEFDGLVGGEWLAQELIALQRMQGGVVIFQHTLSAEKWDTATEELIQWYVREFWELREGEELPQFVIFLNIIFPQEGRTFLSRLLGGTNRKDRIIQELHRIAKSCGPVFHILRELKSIPYADVVNWIDEYYPSELAGFADILFEENSQKRLPMAYIEPKVQQEIRRLNQARARRHLFEEEGQESS